MDEKANVKESELGTLLGALYAAIKKKVATNKLSVLSSLLKDV